MISLINKTQRNNQNNTPFRAGVWFLICCIIQRGIQFIMTPIYTRILSPEGYGMYSTFLTWCNLFAAVTTIGLSGGVFNKAMAKFDNNRDDYLTSMIGLSFTATLISGLLYCLTYNFTHLITGLTVFQSVMMYICIFFQMVIQLWSARQRYEFLYKDLIKITFLFAIIIPIIGITLYYNVFRSENGLIVGYAVANLIVGCLVMKESIHRSVKLYEKSFWLFALKFNIPLLPHYLSNIILGQSDRLMIKHYNGEYYTGLYTLAYQISLILSMVFNSVENAFTPWLYENIKEGNLIGVKARINQLISLSILPLFLIMLLGPEIIYVLGSVEYIEAIYVIPPVVVATYLMFLNTFVVSVLFYFGMNFNVMLHTLFGALINVILNVIFLPKYGFIAAAYTTLVSYLFIVIANYITVNLRINSISVIIYDFKFLLICTFLILFLCYFAIKLYSTWFIIRLSICLLVIIFALLNIISFIKILRP